MRGEWRKAAAHLSLQTTRPNVDVRSRRRAHVKSTGAAEPRREKIFALEDVQAVRFGGLWPLSESAESGYPD
jgi:hypothetical protein